MVTDGGGADGDQHVRDDCEPAAEHGPDDLDGGESDGDNGSIDQRARPSRSATLKLLAASLTVTGSSLTTSLVASSGIVFGGSGEIGR